MCLSVVNMPFTICGTYNRSAAVSSGGSNSKMSSS